MKNCKKYLPILVLLAAACLTHAAYAQSKPRPTSSAANSASSDTRANNIIAACNAAVEELKVTRVLVESLEAEDRLLRERLEIEKRTAAELTELNETRRSESDALRRSLEAKNETILAKDALIQAQEKLIQALKTKRRSPLARLGDILLGAAVIAVLK